MKTFTDVDNYSSQNANAAVQQTKIMYHTLSSNSNVVICKMLYDNGWNNGWNNWV
jgi:hypothetical protein